MDRVLLLFIHHLLNHIDLYSYCLNENNLIIIFFCMYMKQKSTFFQHPATGLRNSVKRQDTTNVISNLRCHHLHKSYFQISHTARIDSFDISLALSRFVCHKEFTLFPKLHLSICIQLVLCQHVFLISSFTSLILCTQFPF